MEAEPRVLGLGSGWSLAANKSIFDGASVFWLNPSTAYVL